MLVSTDGGSSYTEISDADLNDYPIHVRMEGLDPDVDNGPTLYRHPSWVDSDAGIYVLVDEDESWTRVTGTTTWTAT